MIIPETTALLAADSALKTLLGAKTGDTKIYPLLAPMTARPPYVVLRASGGAADEYTQDESVTIEVTADDFAAISKISARVCAALEAKRGTTGRVFYARRIGVTDLADERMRPTRALSYLMRFI